MNKKKVAKKSGFDKEVDDVEKWVYARRKFFIRLALAVVFVLVLFVIGSFIDSSL
jgi:hypothetical protein